MFAQLYFVRDWDLHFRIRIAKNSFLEMNEVDCRSLLWKVASHIICIHSYVQLQQ